VRGDCSFTTGKMLAPAAWAGVISALCNDGRALLHASPSLGAVGVYRDLTLCGTGATSRVYRAVDSTTGRAVALKRLNRHLIRTSQSLARFRRELDALRRVQHPGIAKVHDVIDWDGDPTLVMEFIEGADLHELVVDAGPLDGDVALRVARELLDILAAAHGAGIVHRDVKPQNVRLRPDGQVVLLDFGSARLDAASKLTTTGTSVGTPEFMPPELFAGSAYDPRVDIYGAGATLFFALTGAAPHTADSLAELATLRHTVDAPPVAGAAKGTPEALAQVIDRCLARDPSRRYSTASLATWALDHPEIERAFAARRSRQPSCLHCDAQIAPESAVCPQCKSQHPFGYAAGLCHVDIVSVSEPTRFISHVLAQFPEHDTPEGIRALAERCAALSFEHQRYVSFIDREQALAVVARLAKHGATAAVVEERAHVPRSLGIGLATMAGWYVVPWLFWMLFGRGSVYQLFDFSSVNVPQLLLAFVAGYALSLASSLKRARAGILGPGPTRPLARPAVVAWAAVGWLVSLVWLYFSLRAYPDGLVVPSYAGAAIGSAALLAALVVSWRASLARAPTGAAQSPEPPFLVKLKVAIVPSRSVARARTTRSTLWMAAAAAALVIAEVGVIGTLIARENALQGGREWVSWNRVERYADELTRRVRRSLEMPPEPYVPPAPVEMEPRSWLETYLGEVGTTAGMTVCLLASGFLLVLARRRRRKIRTDADRIGEELGAEGVEAPATRLPPNTRRLPTDQGAAAEVATLDGADGFARDAVWRAADLAHHLQPASSVRLASAIVAMGSRKNDGALRERSMLARSILETDAGQRARFELLELEGELEAEAAETWWQRRRC
jgi:serine/threonine protein kinase